MECPTSPLGYNWRGDDVEGGNDSLPFYVSSTNGDFKGGAGLRSTIPEPHFIPGYTGYTPGSTNDTIGMRYGYYTHKLLADHRVAGGRLSRIPGDFVVPGLNPPSTVPDNPHKTLEPHFVPGYTGFIPGSGIKRSECVGETYGRTTHIKLAKHFQKGGRLRPIFEYPAEYVAKEEDRKFHCYVHELTRDDLKRRSGLVPGYAGYIPRAVFRHGKNRTKIAEESVAEFQKLLNKDK